MKKGWRRRDQKDNTGNGLQQQKMIKGSRDVGKKFGVEMKNLKNEIKKKMRKMEERMMEERRKIVEKMSELEEWMREKEKVVERILERIGEKVELESISRIIGRNDMIIVKTGSIEQKRGIMRYKLKEEKERLEDD
ncbi:hypothetical protein K0M31_012616 [Melipona bicolor]|uniref:Uncharacterized protein n=1 Tax=Melipona bicolor TaxID=60889 RepID=A0AA40FJQ6_9HYME|nr:hypothetical protein K0M31_012616 [Melipona bicolor]